MLAEINENFTAKDKRIITNDWNDYFKCLKRYRVLDICNRLGPLIISIYLKMSKASMFYVPSFSVHNLCREFDALTVTLNIQGKVIKPQKHNEMYIQEAQSLEKRAYIPLEGNVHIDEIINGYKKFFETPYKTNFTEYEDMALICGLTKDKKRIESSLNLVYSELKSWENVYFEEFNGFENWFKDLEQRVWNPERLSQIVESELKKHKLEKLPVREILF